MGVFIEETRAGGKMWHSVSRGLSVPWRSHMVERFIPVADELFAVLSSGELIAAPLATLVWRPVLPDVQNIAVVAAFD